MRPLGGLILGSYIDRKGRRIGLIVTLSLMAVGTLSIALTPGYDRIGLIAPVLVLAGRLVQGFSAGCELGGVSVYLAEIATPGHRGFYCSFQSASQQVAVVFASLLGVVLNSIIPAEQMAAWGWRIPLLIGCLIAPADPVPAQLPEGDRGVSVAQTSSERVGSAAHHRPELGGGGGRRHAVVADDDHLLSHHRLHADIRQSGAASRAA